MVSNIYGATNLGVQVMYRQKTAKRTRTTINKAFIKRASYSEPEIGGKATKSKDVTPGCPILASTTFKLSRPVHSKRVHI